MKYIWIPLKWLVHNHDTSPLCFAVGYTDSCQGDSGGPLFYWSRKKCIKEDSRCKASLMGIVSRGDGCALNNKPGTYTQVNFYLMWMQNKIKRRGMCKRKWIIFNCLNTTQKVLKVWYQIKSTMSNTRYVLCSPLCFAFHQNGRPPSSSPLGHYASLSYRFYLC